MKTPLRFAMLVAALVSAAIPVCLLGKQQQGPHWSVDLTRYGYPTEHHGAATVPYSDATVAASNNNVVLALNVEQDGGITGDAFLNSTWQLSLLVFNAENGKLGAKCGPWPDGIWFEVLATDGGNFLLHLEPPHSERNNATGQLVLLSPTCEVLQHLQLPLPIVKGRDNSLLLSPSRHTLLTSTPTAGGTEYDLRDANTLAMRTSWTDTSRRNPQVVSVSDDGLLGVKPAGKASAGFSPVRVFYRTFETQQWREIPTPNPYQSVTFISNEAFLETTTNGRLAPCASSAVRIRVRTVDGTANLSTIVSQRNYNIGTVSPFAVSLSGNYFADVLRFTNEAWLWCQLDMGPEHYKAYVWSSQNAKPAARIGLASGLSMHPPLAFAPNDSWFAIRNKEMLTVRPLPRQRIPKP